MESQRMQNKKRYSVSHCDSKMSVYYVANRTQRKRTLISSAAPTRHKFRCRSMSQCDVKTSHLLLIVKRYATRQRFNGKSCFCATQKTAFLPNVLLKMRWVFQSDEEITEMIFTSNSIPSKALVLFSFNSRVKRAILTRFSYHLCNSSTPKRGDRGKQDKV